MTEVDTIQTSLLSREIMSLRESMVEMDINKMKSVIMEILAGPSIGDMIHGILQGHRTYLTDSSIKASCNRNSEGVIDGPFNIFDDIGNLEYAGVFVKGTITLIKYYSSPLGIYTWSDSCVKDKYMFSLVTRNEGTLYFNTKDNKAEGKAEWNGKKTRFKNGFIKKSCFSC